MKGKMASVLILVIGVGIGVGVAPKRAAAVGEYADMLLALQTWFGTMQMPEWAANIAQISQGSNQNVRALGQLGNEIITNDTDIYNQETRQRYQPPPNVCQTVRAGSWVKTAELGSAGVLQPIESGTLGSTMETAVPIDHTKNRVDRHNTLYCSEADRARGACERVSPLPNGDMSANLFYGPARYTAEQKAAALAYAENVVNPSAPGLIDQKLERTSQGEAFRGAVITVGARKALAMRSFAQAILDRSVQDGSEQAIMETFEEEIDRRFGSGEWTDEVLQLPPEAAQREILLLKAMEMKMRLNEYKQGQRIEALLAALVAAGAEDYEGTVIQDKREAALKTQEHG